MAFMKVNLRHISTWAKNLNVFLYPFVYFPSVAFFFLVDSKHVRGKSFSTQWLMQMLCNLFMKKKRKEEWMKHKTISHFFLAAVVVLCCCCFVIDILSLFVCLIDVVAGAAFFLFKLHLVNWKVKWNTDLLCATFTNGYCITTR